MRMDLEKEFLWGGKTDFGDYLRLAADIVLVIIGEVRD